MRDELIYVRPLEVVEPEEQKPSRLHRMVKMWAKLSDDEQRQFRRHIEGVLPISLESELIPTIEASRILRVSFYKVKKMVEDGELQPTKTRRDYFGKVNGYLFRRADVEALRDSTSGESRESQAVARRKAIYDRHQAGESFEDIAASLSLSKGRTAQLFEEYESVQGVWFEVRYAATERHPVERLRGKEWRRQFRAMNVERALYLFNRKHGKKNFTLLALEPIA